MRKHNHPRNIDLVDIARYLSMNDERTPVFGGSLLQGFTTTKTPIGNQKPRPVNILETAERHVPNRAWTIIAKHRMKHRNRFPKWCYFPYLDFVHLMMKKSTTDQKLINVLHLLSAWRATQGIYQIDRDLLKEITRSPFTGDIPVEVLVHLPEWCVYVQLPDRVKVGGTSITGFFAMMTLLGRDTEEPRLSVLWDYSDMEPLDYDSIELNGTIPESIDAFMEMSPGVFRRGMGTRILALTEGDRVDLYQRFNLVIPILLYLASIGKFRDIRSSNRDDSEPARPYGSNIKPPKAPQQWQVGWRIGPVLARAVGEAERSEMVARGTHASPRPHIRRGHYRRCRVGPGRFGTRIVWIPPVPVNFRYGDAVPVVRPVKGKVARDDEQEI